MRVRILVPVLELPEDIAWSLIHQGQAELVGDDQHPGGETYAVQKQTEAAVTRRPRRR